MTNRVYSLVGQVLAYKKILAIGLICYLITLSFYVLYEKHNLAIISNRDKLFFVRNYQLSNESIVLKGYFVTHGVNSSYLRSESELKVQGIERLLSQIKPDMLIDEKFQKTNLPYEMFFKVNRNVKAVICSEIFNKNKSEITRAVEVAKTETKPHDEITSAEYINRTADCQRFIKSRGYIMSSLTKVEEDFPISFSIIMFKDVWQFERLLRAIYRPQNFYCIHADANAPNETKKAVGSISNCFRNVFLASRLIPVYWGRMSVLEADLTCMEDLWKVSKAWKYFINLTGQEFPLRTNYELVQILTAFKGVNDVKGIPQRVDFPRLENAGPPPHGLTPMKGSVHVVVSRGFVNSVLHDPKIADLLNWTRHTKVPDETFFATVHQNPSLKVPGSYKVRQCNIA